MTRTGIIIAAGIGSRLDQSATVPFLKPLAMLDGKPIILRTIESLQKADCDKIVIVLGWEAETIRKKIQDEYRGPLELQFVFNRRHDLQNGISVLSAKSFVHDEFILLMSDHLFDDQIMTLISNHTPTPYGAILCVDYKLETIFDIDDATKVLEASGFVKDIGKHLKEYNCIDTGAFIGTYGLFEAIEQVYAQKGDASISDGVQVLSDAGLMGTMDIGDAYWQDIDTPEMLSHAEKLLRSHIHQ